MRKILIIEDDPVIRSMLGKHLEQWGYETRAVEDFHAVLDVVRSFEPHLILLDINLPFFNGYYWCQEIRKESQMPILFLSSRNQPMDIVMAINMGGDYFVTKPFDLSVLLAKVQGVLRRSYDFAGDKSLLSWEGVTLDLKSMQVSYDEQTEDLTKNEFQILRVLLERSQAVVSRDDLMKELWNSDLFIDDNTLTVNVARLRRKLAAMGLPDMIVTKKGVGYGVMKRHG